MLTQVQNTSQASSFIFLCILIIVLYFVYFIVVMRSRSLISLYVVYISDIWYDIYDMTYLKLQLKPPIISMSMRYDIFANKNVDNILYSSPSTVRKRAMKRFNS